MSVYLGDLKLESGTKYRVGRQFFNPPEGYQEPNLGIVIESIPDPKIPSGQVLGNTYVDTSTNEVTYDYLTPPPTIEESIAQITLALVNGGLM